MKDFDQYLQYFRYFRDETIPEDFAWWFCRSDREVYQTQEIYERFGYAEQTEIISSGDFVELDRVDVIALYREYLHPYVGKQEIKTMRALPDDAFSVSFRVYIERNHLDRSWFDFEQKALQAVFETWRTENHVVL